MNYWTTAKCRAGMTDVFLGHIAVVFFAVLGLASCGGNRPDPLPTNPPQFSARSWIAEQELDANPNLHVLRSQLLILGLKDAPAASGATSDEKSVHKIRYYLEESELFIARLNPADACLKEITIDNSQGERMATLNGESPSANVQLQPGRYLVTFYEPTPLPKECSVVFVQPKRPVTTSQLPRAIPVTAPLGKNILRLFSGYDPTQGLNFFLAQDLRGPSYQYEKNGAAKVTTSLRYVYYDWKSPCASDNCAAVIIPNDTGSLSFFSITFDSAVDKGWMLSTRDQVPFGCYIRYDTQDPAFGFVPGLAGVSSAGCYRQASGAQVATPFNYTFTQSAAHDFSFRLPGRFVSYANPGVGNSDGAVVGLYGGTFSQSSGAYALVGAERVPWGMEQDLTIPLHEVLRWYPNPNNSEADLPAEPQSGEVILYSGTKYTGQAIVVNSDTNYLGTSPVPIRSPMPIRSIRVPLDTTTIRFFNGVTIGANTEDTTDLGLAFNGDVSGRGAYQVNFQIFRASDYWVTKHCPACNLAEVDLSGMNLDNSDFAGANLTDANLKGASLKSADLHGALLMGANLNNANLGGASLCKAFLNASPYTSRSATLSGAYMANANLAYAQMTGAQMDHVSFHTSFGGNLCQPSDCTVASTSAGSCASAYRATMTGVDLSFSYLSGLDLSGATLQDTNFSNTFALGTNFTGASFSTSSSGVSAKFINAILFGALFDNTAVQGSTFKGALVDDPSQAPATGSRLATIYLSRDYTSFPGSQYAGSAVCPIVSIANITSLPLTDASAICPDGSNGPCQGTKWQSGKALSSLQDILLLFKAPASNLQPPAACGGVFGWW